MSIPSIMGVIRSVQDGKSRTPLKPLGSPCAVASEPNAPLSAAEVYAALSELRPDDAITVQESPSNLMDLQEWWPTIKPASYFTYASGALGFGVPAAVGVALGAEARPSGRVQDGARHRGPNGHHHSNQAPASSARWISHTESRFCRNSMGSSVRISLVRCSIM